VVLRRYKYPTLTYLACEIKLKSPVHNTMGIIYMLVSPSGKR